MNTNKSGCNHTTSQIWYDLKKRFFANHKNTISIVNFAIDWT